MKSYFDGEGEEVDLLEGLDLAVLDEAAKLGDGHPLLLLLAAPASAPAVAATTASATASTVAAAAATAESASETSTFTGWSCVRHSAVNE